ncbi:MAG: amidohydrolase family protein [Desulfuromusa sp.]|nr:amidohydrolase family protein [Desulfuromusa sp.]
MKKLSRFKLFDSHFHIIDKSFPLIENRGYLPDNFSTTAYRERTKDYSVVGGAIVSGSFQAFDQSYLLAALGELGPNFVGVTQLPATVSDEELIRLNRAGMRAVRFNLKQGGSEGIEKLEHFSRRVYEVVGWHTELYVDSKDLPELHNILIQLPRVSIDHLGLSQAGLPNLLSLVEKGVFIKATGFGRVDFSVKSVLREIAAINPDALMFGTDLPSTRAPRPYSDDDYFTVIDALGEKLAQKVFYENGVKFYRPKDLSNK